MIAIFPPGAFTEDSRALDTRTTPTTFTSNARDIFRVLAEYQLQNPEEKGMGFHAFYTECRAQFLATSEVTLRSHLTEFVDHELTRARKGADGEDVVHAPFASDVLAQLLKEIQGV